MQDVVDALSDGFMERIGVLVERHKEAVSALSDEDARQLGAQGADAALAPVVWAAAVGERWPTTMVAEFLHVTRQALHKRIANGTVLGLPGRGTTWFPTWQFDLDAHEIRSVVADVIAAFVDELGTVNPLVIASWVTTTQPELGLSPEEWLNAGKDQAEVVRIAKRAAAELGR